MKDQRGQKAEKRQGFGVPENTMKSPGTAKRDRRRVKRGGSVFYEEAKKHHEEHRNTYRPVKVPLGGGRNPGKAAKTRPEKPRRGKKKPAAA
ncbi:MAG: hypothetical protein HY952_03320 [Elusimicrobia bacterium]|nr:hypothetical protein [Elusimicrobiota bacterium]